MAFFAERLTAAQELTMSRSVDITTAGTVVDLANAGFSFVRLTAATQLTSLVAGTTGKLITLVNANTVSLLIKNLTGTVGNQIITGTGADFSVPPGSCLSLIYDDAATVWRRFAAASIVNVLQSGNAFGADFTIGATDNFNSILVANNTEVLRLRPVSAANANARVSGTAGLEIPFGTTGQRPSSPVVGTLRINTSVPALEAYYNATWNTIGNPTVVSPIQGSNTVTAIPATFIGEELRSVVNTSPWFAASGNNGAGFTINLTPGLWDVYGTYNVSTIGATFSNLSLNVWLGVDFAGGADLSNANGLTRLNFNPSTVVPGQPTVTTTPLRVSYNGTTMTMPGGQTNATGIIYFKANLGSFTGTPTYEGTFRAVRVQ